MTQKEFHIRCEGFNPSRIEILNFINFLLRSTEHNISDVLIEIFIQYPSNLYTFMIPRTSDEIQFNDTFSNTTESFNQLSYLV